MEPMKEPFDDPIEEAVEALLEATGFEGIIVLKNGHELRGLVREVRTRKDVRAHDELLSVKAEGLVFIDPREVAAIANVEGVSEEDAGEPEAGRGSDE